MNLKPILEKLYPEGSIGGQCGDFAHKLVDFGSVGDSYASKKRYVNLYGIIAPNIQEIGKGFRVGDVLITSEGTFMGIGNGHVAVVIDLIDGDPIVVESNFKKDQKVHYGRKVSISKIYGIIRGSLKLDLGVCEINYSVLINNQKWQVGFLDELSKQMGKWTNGKLKVNFFPLQTKLENWWYETIVFPFTNTECKVISKLYLDVHVNPLASANGNKQPDVMAFIVRPDQWQGSITGGVELAYCNPSTGQIQASCAEFDLSPSYAGMRLVNHILPHELAHRLAYVNGLNDNTHYHDNQMHQLERVFEGLDFNRIKANL